MALKLDLKAACDQIIKHERNDIRPVGKILGDRLPGNVSGTLDPSTLPPHLRPNGSRHTSWYKVASEV